MKPSQQIQKALEGALSLDELEPASISSMRLAIYNIACKVLALPSNDMKREEIENHPEGIQVLIRAECRRIYDMRHKP
jgi:hypothetical protein